MAKKNEPFRVLIAGAGIGGLAAAISLARVSGIPNLDIQIYEQAPELLEIGASIALSPNGLRTLERLGVHEALSDELGFRGPSGIPQIFRHWKTNQVLSVDTHTNVHHRRHQTTRFHRGHLHAALLSHVPRSSIHLDKRVIRAEAGEDAAVLYFEDGSEAHGDLIIAADGLRSKVRQSLIPDYQLKFTGKVFVRSTFDASLVEGKIPDLPPDAIHWWGPKDSFFASRLGKDQYTTVGAYDDPRSGPELDAAVTWNQPGRVDLFRARFGGDTSWNPVVRQLAERTPSVRLFPNYASHALPSWLPAPRAALLGDAAHAHGGAFAAGGSLALDDALALGLALRHVAPGSGGRLGLPEIRRALTLYDGTRRPHATRLLGIIHGALRTARESYGTGGEGEEEEALIRRFKNRPDLTWLSEHDVEAALKQTVEELEGTQGRQQLVVAEARSKPKSKF